MEDWKECAGYNLLQETRKWIDDLEKKVEKMRRERVEDVNDLKDMQIQLTEIITRLDMTLQGQEKLLQGLIEDNTNIRKNVREIDKEIHNGLIAKKAEEWFYRSIGKWVIGLFLANFGAIILFIIKQL